MKRLFCCILALLILMSVMSVSVNASTLEEELSVQMFDYFGGNEIDLSYAVGFYRPMVYPVGDVDLDYEVSVLDATLIQMRVAQLTGIDSIHLFEVADIDCDGELSVLDATAIQLKLAGLE